MAIETIFSIAILVMSVVVHEVAHGLVADRLGDPTARYAGRLTLNPLKHLDPLGSVILPLLLILMHAPFVFGWAKPVPYNPYNLSAKRFGDALVAGAGPLANLVIALVVSLIVVRFLGDSGYVAPSFVSIASTVVFINIVLAVFNLIPIPPLDGSRILFSVLPHRFRQSLEFLERYWIFVLFVFIVFLWDLFFPVVGFLFRIFTGLST